MGQLRCCRKAIGPRGPCVLTVPLPQVLSGNLLPDAVSWFFTGVLKGLQTHGQHDGCMAALVHLAFQIYEALVRSCSLLGRGVGREEGGKTTPKPAWFGVEELTAPRDGSCITPNSLPQRPRYAELKAVMEQIPDIQKDSLEQFDSKLLNPALQKVADKRRKDHFKRLITGCIGVGDAPGETSPFPSVLCPWGLNTAVKGVLAFCGDGGSGG